MITVGGQTIDPLLILTRHVFGGTNHPVDLMRASIGLSWARAHGCYPEALAALMAIRKDWLGYTTQLQRHWQLGTRRPARARHHDSIAIREKYVRCQY